MGNFAHLSQERKNELLDRGREPDPGMTRPSMSQRKIYCLQETIASLRSTEGVCSKALLDHNFARQSDDVMYRPWRTVRHTEDPEVFAEAIKQMVLEYINEGRTP
jgi:hypothetical protein